MKIVITKSKTEKIRESYIKTIFTLESDEIKENQLESTKERSESQINEWLGLNEKVGNFGSKPHKGICQECGIKINPKYTYCFKCNEKHKREN